MAQTRQPKIEIDDLQPKSNIAGYRASWQEGTLTAYAYLEPIEDQPGRGYSLEYTYEHAQPNRRLSDRQIDAGTTLISKVRELMTGQLLRAGWREIGKDEKRRPIWQHTSRIADIEIDSLSPRPGPDGYTLRWRENGVLVCVSLNPIEDQPGRGYTLSLWSENATRPETPLDRDQLATVERVTPLANKRMIEGLDQAGWKMTFIEDQPIWKHREHADIISAPVQDCDRDGWARQDEKPFDLDSLEPGRLEYRARWKHGNILTVANLQAIDGDGSRGYRLTSRSTRIDGYVLSSKIQERGQAFARELYYRFSQALERAGWSLQQDTWSCQVKALPEKQRTLVVPAREETRGYTRTITAQEVTYTCVRCGQVTSKLVFPGRAPEYCDTCAAEVKREKTRARVARLRAGKKGEQVQAK